MNLVSYKNHLQKAFYLLAFVLFLQNNGWGQVINENIQSWTNRVAYGNYTQTIASGTVTMTRCIVANGASGTGTCTVGRIQLEASTGVVELPTLSSVGTVEVHLAAGGAGRTVALEYFNGSIWVNLTTFTAIGTTGVTYTYVYNTASVTTLRLSLPSAALYVHDIIVTANACSAPLDPSGTITPASNPACSSTNLTYSAPNANLYWQTTVSGTSTINPTTNDLNVTTTGTYYVRTFDGISCWSTGTVNSGVITINNVPLAPTLSAASSVTPTSFSANWVASTAATTYYLDVCTDAGFTTFVLGYNNLNVGNVLTFNVTGLSSNVTYYYRVRASNTCGISGNSVAQNTTTTKSSTSDIITAGGTSATISSILNTISPLTSTTGIQVWQITVRDGGASSPDADDLPTILTAFNIAQVSNTVSNWSQAIKTIELFDGATNVGIATVTATQIQFTGLNIIVADNSTKTLSLRLSLNCGIGASNFDLDRFGFSITNGNVTFSPSGSGKTTFSAAQTGGTGINVINVVATKLVFTQQPTTTSESQAMAPSVIVKATDDCGNTDVDFTGIVTITSTGNMASSPQTFSAIAGVAIFGSIVHSIVGNGFTLSATTAGLIGTTSVTFDITSVTIFSGGDMAIVGICVNQGLCGGASGEDEVSLVSFVDITPGTSFHMTDNGFERVGCGTNTWGNTEGVITITRTTSTLPAGTIFTFRIMNTTVFSGINPDNNWSITYPVGNSFNLNNNDEQVYLMQGGSWDPGVILPTSLQNATFTGGTYMFAINTFTAWTCNDSSTTRGAMPLPLTCFSIMPSTGTVNVKYTGLTTSASKNDWINRLNNISNWSASTNCSTYNAQAPVYSSGFTFSIVPGGYNSGYWTGALNTNWFDCHNWQNYEVPDSLVNVVVNNVANDPIIGSSPSLYPNGAICNDLLITDTSGSGILTLDETFSYLSIKGNIINNGIITGTNGVTELRSTNSQSFSGTGSTQFYNLRLNNTNVSGVSLNQDLSVSNSLTFTNGILSTGTNNLSITNTLPPTIFGYNSSKYINGNLLHHISSNASTYVFPIGDGTASTNYKRFDLINNFLTGTSSVTANVANVAQGSPAADIDANLGTLATQNGTQLTNVLNSAIWTLTPDLQPSGGNYGVNLYVENVSNLSASDDNMFCPLKRADTSTSYTDWSSFEELSTAIPSIGAPGRVYNTGAGYAQRTGYQLFSKHVIAKAPMILPIELLYFTAKVNQKYVDLNWSTVAEINNDYFTIERSINAIQFESVIVKDGAGNSHEKLSYSTVDKSPLSGISYYRLKQTDFDGKFSYSHIVSVNIGPSNGLQLINAFNSSENNLLNVVVNCATNCLVNVELYDMMGKIIGSSSQNINDNKQTVSMSTEGLSHGIYFLKVFNENSVVTRKLKL